MCLNPMVVWPESPRGRWAGLPGKRGDLPLVRQVLGKRVAWLKRGQKWWRFTSENWFFWGKNHGFEHGLRLTCLISQLGEDFWSKNSDFEHLNWRIWPPNHGNLHDDMWEFHQQKWGEPPNNQMWGHSKTPIDSWHLLGIVDQSKPGVKCFYQSRRHK
jgi:hypothetical protein